MDAELPLLAKESEPLANSTDGEEETREELREKARKHFAKVSADLPFWKRIKPITPSISL